MEILWRRSTNICITLMLITACCAQNNLLCVDGDLRLVDGKHDYEGRVEICLSGEWGTVCDDLWDTNDAVVVCRQLGLNFSAAIPVSRAYYGPGTGPTILDDVGCSGSEERLLDCPHNGLEVHNCGRSEDAGVYCQPLDEACSDGDIRLAGDREVENEGRVEICHQGQWGTVCDDRWENHDASVACVQLGYPPQNAIAVSRAMYGHGIGRIIYDEMDCSGNERNLTDCYSSGLLVNDCQHSEDAGVLCGLWEGGQCSNGDLRLADGRDSTEGRLEVCFNGRWGTVCDDQFGGSDARVVCRQLGFSAEIAYSQPGATFGQGTGPIFLDSLRCRGSETALLNCRHDGIGFHDCHHDEDVSVICQALEERCVSGEMRLMDGDFPNEGRVEVCLNNHWGTVCNSMFDAKDATVVCNQLGYTNGDVIQIQGGFYGDGLGMVWLKGLQCLGNETNLLQCPVDHGYYHCSHSYDVSVICPVGEEERQCGDGEVRLLNGSLSSEGLVEICYNGRWGAICQDHWDEQDTMVACHQAGFPGNSVIPVKNGLFSSSNGPIFLDSVSCNGSESRLSDCFDHATLGSHRCSDSRGHAGVICTALKKTCENGEVRLVGGGTLLEGRVEMCYNSRWGTVCDSMWDSRDAGVVCQQISNEYGLDYNNAVAVTGSGFGRSSGPHFLKDLLCVGTEDSLLECRRAEVRIHDCKHNAGVYCGLQPCEEGALRLSDGIPGTNNTGRVEMCIRNVWSGLCDEEFIDSNAEVVCKQLGFSPKYGMSVGGDFFGHGFHVPSWSVSLDCDSNRCNLVPETRTQQCYHVGVFCEKQDDDCGTGDIRLVGGANMAEGRVEVCINGVWGKVCDDSWDDNAAKVVCGQLQISANGANAVPSSFWSSSSSSSSLDYFLDDVKCIGNESQLLDCHSSPVLSHNCIQSEEAGVVCHKVMSQGLNRSSTAAITGEDKITQDLKEEEEKDGGEDMYSPGQVVAIILPVVLAMTVVMVAALAGMWLVLQRRKRMVNQSDNFPIIPGQGIAQFSEFSSESDSLDKINNNHSNTKI